MKTLSPRPGMGLVIILVALVAAGYAHYLGYFSLEKRATSSPSAQAAGSPPPVAVSTLTLQPEPVRQTLILPGRVTAVRQAEVRPQVSGVLLSKTFEEGAQVKQGDLLYQLDAERYRAAYAKAQADLKSARTTINLVESRAKRYSELVATGAVSQQTYEDAQMQLEQAYASIEVAQAQMELSRINLDYTEIRAPISGIIGRSLVTEGALVTENQSEPLARITQLDPIFVDMQLPAEQRPRLQRYASGEGSLRVSVIADAEWTTELPAGELLLSEVVIDPGTDSLALRARFPNPSQHLLPGQFLRVEIQDEAREALLVPQRATQRTPQGGMTAWIVDADSNAQPVPIEITGAHGESWILRSGLSAGDQVIVTGYQKVRPGSAVQPSPWEAGKSGSAH